MAHKKKQAAVQAAKNDRENRGKGIMAKNWITILIILISVSAYAQKSHQEVIGNPKMTDNNHHVITSNGIDHILLGMKLSDLRKSFPNLTFTRTSDGDGAALIDVKNGDEEFMTLYANEDNSESPIDWSKSIVSIETFDSLCCTKEGIHPGSLIAETEQEYGTLKEIELSEIESRQFASFEKQPLGLEFIIDYCGKFKEGSNRTSIYSKDCKIFSISIIKKK